MLTKKSNRKHFPKISTAWHTLLPPTLYMGVNGRYARVDIEWDDSIGDWYEVPLPQSHRTELDVRLEAGYQFYLDAKCPKCGVPFWYGHSEDSRILFKVEESKCYSCEVVEREQKQRSKNSSSMAGVTLIAVPTGTEYEDGSTEPLPTPYEAMAQMQ